MLRWAEATKLVTLALKRTLYCQLKVFITLNVLFMAFNLSTFYIVHTAQCSIHGMGLSSMFYEPVRTKSRFSITGLI